MSFRATALLLLLFVSSCEKKEEPSKPAGKTRESVVNAGLSSAQGEAATAAKSSLVAQHCAIACGVHPELASCTQTCAKECMSAADLAGIDACAKRVATP